MHTRGMLKKDIEIIKNKSQQCRGMQSTILFIISQTILA